MTVEQTTNLTKAINNLAFEVEGIKLEIAELSQAVNRTDDFNNWTYADSLASIANSLVKYNSIENKKSVTREDVKKIFEAI
jgi:hypothetical protein|tara:strand:+ start:570 stop:812 length:243 start_codon:yes stop_codon:yes gene_type:complete